MNEVAVASALKSLIHANRAVLLAGITQEGVAREIKQLTASILTPPELFYYIAIDVRSATQDYTYRGIGVNITHATKMGIAGLMRDRYEAAIYVMDYAYVTKELESATQSFEEEHESFRTLTDRIVKLLDQTDKLAAGSYVMYIPGEQGDEDRTIRKNNRHNVWEDDEGAHFQLLTEIGFRVEACSDSSL